MIHDDHLTRPGHFEDGHFVRDPPTFKPKGMNHVPKGSIVSHLAKSSGGAIGMPRRVESVGAGGNLLHRHPSQISQAHSANFHFHTQFPPGLAEVRGSGLYV